VPLICAVEQRFNIRIAGQDRFPFTEAGQSDRGAGPKNPYLRTTVTEAVKINKKAVFALFLIHFIGDFFQSLMETGCDDLDDCILQSFCGEGHSYLHAGADGLRIML
jgi:hypothetical protein